ncbi:MAG: hypothetical protein ABIQ31_07755 [Ferruginibacter sp.]
MKKQAIFFSPFMAYCFTFMAAMLVYLLDWSYLYPRLSWQLVCFFAGTFLISFITACFFKSFNLFVYNEQTNKIPSLSIFFLLAGYFLDCAWSRTVPFISLATGASTYEDVQLDFGIPTFHVVLVGYNAFISVFYFHTYLSQKRKRTLFLFIISLVLPLLIMSRITITLAFIGCFYIYLFSIRKHLMAKLLKLSAIGLLFLFGFGLLGNIRTAADVSADDVFLAIGDARDSFRESWVPKSFFWGYIYASSPIANLQLTINHESKSANSQAGLKNFLIHELVWDAVSKKYDNATAGGRIGFTQINDAFNVGSIFARPYAYIGFTGMALMYIFIWGISILYILQLDRNSKYYVTYLCFFNALIILCVFDNMLTFTPFALVLLFPLFDKVYSLLNKRKNAL